MTNSPSEQLGEHLRDVLWSLWTEMGVLGTVRNHTDVLLDPEALILFTAELGHLDPRLRTESLDWCIQFGDCISVSRLKNLRKIIGSSERFSQYAAEVNAATTLRWPLDDGGVVDAESVATGKSQTPDLQNRPSLLRLRLRALVGVGARSDVLAELLYRRRCTASELSTVGYSKKQVAVILDDLFRAGLLRRISERNTHKYELVSEDVLSQLIGAPPTYYALWGACFRVLLSFHRVLTAEEKKSQNLKLMALNRVVIEQVDEIESLRWGTPVNADADTFFLCVIDWILERAKRTANGPPDKRAELRRNRMS